MLWAFGKDNVAQFSSGFRRAGCRVVCGRCLMCHVRFGPGGAMPVDQEWILQKIRVTVLVAPPGPALEKVLAHLAGDARDWLVLAPAHMSQAVSQAFALSIVNDGPAVAAGCECCSVRGPLVDALREHFMQALQRRRAPYRQVLCVFDATFDPAGLVAALNHDAFLSQRYQDAGCMAIIAGQHAAAIAPAWLQADVLLTDAAGDALADMLFSINPWAQLVPLSHLPEPGRLMLRAAEAAMLPRPAPAAAGVVSGRQAGGLFSRASRHAGQMFQLSVSLPQPLGRGSLYAALDDFLENPAIFPLRLQGLVHVRPPGQWYVLRALHRHRQPLRELTSEEAVLLDGSLGGAARQGAGGFLCLLQSAAGPRAQAQRLAHALGGRYRLLSPGNNPLQNEEAPAW